MLYTLALPTLGTTELIIILVVVLIIFGPKNLPKLGRMMGRSIREFRSASSKAMGDEDEDDDAPRPAERNIEGQPKPTPHAEQKGNERVSPGS